MDKYHTNPTSDNINEYKKCRANAHNVIKESKGNHGMNMYQNQM